jgi:hypothetical protein
MLISTALLLDSIIRNSVCTPAKLPCRRVEVGYDKVDITVFGEMIRSVYTKSNYNGGQKISSTTVIPLTYAVKQPLGTNNLTSQVHVSIKLCPCSYG